MNNSKALRTIIILSLFINIGIFTAVFYIFPKYNILPNQVPQVLKTVQTVEEKVTNRVRLVDFQNDIIDAIEKTSKSVVSIVIEKELSNMFGDPFGYWVDTEKRQVGGGSGIIIASDGYILTNKHVVDDQQAQYSIVTKDGDILKVTNIWKDPVLDLAVLKVGTDKGDIRNLPIAQIDSGKGNVKIGEFVVAIGNALAEYQDTSTFGIISGLGRSLGDTKDSVYNGLYQLDAPINPGNSGGPLVDMDGSVIGINTAISAQGQGIGFAIPINTQIITNALDSIKKNNKIQRQFLGIRSVELDKASATKLGIKEYQGSYVVSVSTGSAAAQGGLQSGDIIKSINDNQITKEKNLIYQLYSTPLSQSIKLEINRKGKTEIITLTPTLR